MKTYVIRDIPLDRADDQYLAHARVELVDRDESYVTVLGLELPSGTLTMLGPGWLLVAEAETVIDAAHEAALDAEAFDALREPDWDRIRDERDGF